MITVTFYGLLRLDSGLRQVQVEASDLRQLRQALLTTCPTLTKDRLRGCVMLVNGIPANKRTKLKDGYQVSLLSPVAGG